MAPAYAAKPYLENQNFSIEASIDELADGITFAIIQEADGSLTVQKIEQSDIALQANQRVAGTFHCGLTYHKNASTAHIHWTATSSQITGVRARVYCKPTYVIGGDYGNYFFYGDIDEYRDLNGRYNMENLRKAHLKDGVALTKFLCWMKKNAGKVELTETEAAERLEDYRKAQEGYLGPSFTTISAFGSNAAMCHYHATKEQESPVGTDGFYLVDSGGQYYEGTTDVTRTIAVGHVTDEMKEHFTLVMMGMLRLMNAKFLYGCRGLNVDYLARGPLWERGFDFNHGTGHGVGFLSAVHERPNGIRWRIVPERQDSCVLEEGMLTSDEPGLYIEGSHGIRTENLSLCRKAEKNEYGQFMCFENMTFAPIDLDAVDISVMEPSDVRMLNAYHKEVCEKLSPYMTEEENEWLKEATRPIGEDYTWRI